MQTLRDYPGAGEEYRPLSEIGEELNSPEAEARVTEKALRKILEKFVGA